MRYRLVMAAALIWSVGLSSAFAADISRLVAKPVGELDHATRFEIELTDAFIRERSAYSEEAQFELRTRFRDETNDTVCSLGGSKAFESGRKSYSLRGYIVKKAGTGSYFYRFALGGASGSRKDDVELKCYSKSQLDSEKIRDVTINAVTISGPFSSETFVGPAQKAKISLKKPIILEPIPDSVASGGYFRNGGTDRSPFHAKSEGCSVIAREQPIIRTATYKDSDADLLEWSLSSYAGDRLVRYDIYAQSSSTPRQSFRLQCQTRNHHESPTELVKRMMGTLLEISQ